jgi:hypothetical protein
LEIFTILNANLMFSALITRRQLITVATLLACSVVFSGHTPLKRAGGLPDLYISKRIGVNRLSDYTFSYTLTIKNGGTLLASLQNLMVATQLDTEGGSYQTIRTDRFPDLLSGATANQTFLHPGETTTVVVKIKTRVLLPRLEDNNVFYVRVLLDVTNAVKESREDNNYSTGNSGGLN